MDDETWRYHLRRGDYSDWFRSCIKDDSLASEAVTIEQQSQTSPDETRRQIREAIERRYTLPAKGSRLASDEDITKDRAGQPEA